MEKKKRCVQAFYMFIRADFSFTSKNPGCLEIIETLHYI